jgi:UDP-3-O-[3-hydroxymyristoyl] glucosamine N-acyltransferase
MPDLRFYEDLGPATLSEIAELAGAELPGADVGALRITGVAPLARAGDGDVTFLVDKRHVGELTKSAARACFVPPNLASSMPEGCVALVTRHPQYAYTQAADRLHRPRSFASGAPAIDPSVELEDGVRLAPGVVIGPHAAIGRGTVIGPNTVIGPGVTIGRECVVGANASISFAMIGDRVKIYAGVVVGEPGFGAAGGPAGVIDLPQLGRVILQDNVTVGANSCIDRGAWEDTQVGEGTKIDNFVQIAHNVVIGRNCVIAGHTGISGSCTIGDGVAMGGRVGMADHITIGAGARLAANSGVMHDVPAGETWCGVPAVPIRRFMRQVAIVAKLAEPKARETANGA